MVSNTSKPPSNPRLLTPWEIEHVRFAMFALGRLMAVAEAGDPADEEGAKARALMAVTTRAVMRGHAKALLAFVFGYAHDQANVIAAREMLKEALSGLNLALGAQEPEAVAADVLRRESRLSKAMVELLTNIALEELATDVDFIAKSARDQEVMVRWRRLSRVEARSLLVERVLAYIDAVEGPWWEDLDYRAAGWWFSRHAIDYPEGDARTSFGHRVREWIFMEYEEDDEGPATARVDISVLLAQDGSLELMTTATRMLRSVCGVFLVRAVHGTRATLEHIATGQTFAVHTFEHTHALVADDPVIFGRLVPVGEGDRAGWVLMRSAWSLRGLSADRIEGVRRGFLQLSESSLPEGAITEMVLSSQLSAERLPVVVPPAESVEEARTLLAEHYQSTAELEQMRKDDAAWYASRALPFDDDDAAEAWKGTSNRVAPLRKLWIAALERMVRQSGPEDPAIG